MDSEKKIDYCQLPTQVLEELFSYLPLNDRKNTRRVCHLWFDANNIRKFWRQEKFFCDNESNFDDFVRVLTNSSRDILNLEFRSMNFETLPQSLDFWKESGTSIRLLSFKNCLLTAETFEYVHMYCDQLENLSLEDTRPKVRNFCGLTSSFRLERLINSQIIRRKLNTLRIRICENDRDYDFWSIEDTGLLDPLTCLTREFFQAVRILYPNATVDFDSIHQLKIVCMGKLDSERKFILERRNKKTNERVQRLISTGQAKIRYKQLVIDYYESRSIFSKH